MTDTVSMESRNTTEGIDEMLCSNCKTLMDRAVKMGATNPLVNCEDYHGWHIREYKNGMIDATDGQALSPGFRSYETARNHVDAENAGDSR
jgi:outer membrane usher protein FimD/PapC